jgi:hypothetical protein
LIRDGWPLRYHFSARLALRSLIRLAKERRA